MKTPVPSLSSLARAVSACVVAAGLLGACAPEEPADGEEEDTIRSAATMDPCDPYTQNRSNWAHTGTVTITLNTSGAVPEIVVNPKVAHVDRSNAQGITWDNRSDGPIAIVLSGGPRRPPPGQPHIPLPGNPNNPSDPKRTLQNPLDASIISIPRRGSETARGNPQAFCGEYKYSVVAHHPAADTLLRKDPPIHVVF